MGTISQDEVIEVLKIVEESSFDELHLEMGDFKLILKKHGGGETVREPLRIGVSSAQSEVVQEVRSEKIDVIQTEPEKGVPGPEETRQEVEPIVGRQEEGYIPIRSPMLGTFYRAPKPGAPPFVEEGQMVNVDDTVCIIEVMKLFNTVKSGVRGRIAKILVEDAQMVEYKQALFLVEEDPAAESAGEVKG
jgi:acetyl-CoA carboxylase biotin carboxyl carrier protein